MGENWRETGTGPAARCSSVVMGVLNVVLVWGFLGLVHGWDGMGLKRKKKKSQLWVSYGLARRGKRACS